MQLVLVLAFYALIFWVGVWFSRREQKSSGSKEFMLAGRKLPIAIALLTMTATWVGGAYLNGTAEMVYGSGMIWAQAPWGYAVSLLLGGLIFAKIMRKHEFRTMLDPFDQRVGKKTTAWLFIPALVGEIFWSAAVLTALGLTFATIADIPTVPAILISATVVIAYTMLGGLRSVAYTDVVQLGLIFLGLGIAIPFMLNSAGGLGTVWTDYQAKFGHDAYLFPALNEFANLNSMGGFIYNWLDFAILLVFGGIPWQVYFQRVLSSDSPKTAVRMSVAAAFGCILLAIPAGLIGMVGATVDWTAFGAVAPENANMVLPAALKSLVPVAVGTVGLAALAAATMSSMDSSILSVSSMYTWNIYRRIINPKATDQQVAKTTKVAIIIVGTLATVLALSVQSVYALWYLCSDLVFVILFPQLLLSLYYKKYNAIGAISGIVVGFLLRIGGGEATFGLPGFIPYPLPGEDGYSLFPFRVFAMVASLLTIIVVSALTQKQSPSVALHMHPAEPESDPEPATGEAN